MLDKALCGSKKYWGLILVLLAIIGVGVLTYAYQLKVGLGVTGMSRDVSWGFYIAQLTFLVGVAASAVMLVIPVYIYKRKELHHLVVFGELLAVAAIIMCLLFIVADLGRPDQMHHMALRFNFPLSVLTWDVIALNGD